MWRDGLWLKLWDMGVEEKMWRVVKGMYEASKSAALLGRRGRVRCAAL